MYCATDLQGLRSFALWLKATARGWPWRDSLRGLDCVLRVEAWLKVREKVGMWTPDTLGSLPG